MSEAGSVDCIGTVLARSFPAGEHVGEVLDAAMDGILVVDSTRRIAFANRSAGRIFGHAPEAMLGQPLELLVPPTARHLHDRQVGHFLQHGRSERGHRVGFVTGVHADGHELTLDVTISRINAWQRGAAVAIVRDASDRLAQEQALRERDLRFQLVAQASGDVLYEWRRSTGITWFGDALTRVLGHDPAAACTSEWWQERIHPDDRPRVLASLMDFHTSNRAEWCEEYRFRRHDGTYATLLNRSTSSRDDGGRVDGTVGALMDVTALRAAEDARLSLEAQLQQAQKMEAIGRLAGGVAHDFNNLLTVIIGNLALAQGGVGRGEPVAREIDETMSAARRAADLTRQLLAFARRQVMTPRVVDLNDAAQQALRLVQRLIGERITIDWSPAATPLWVRIDPTQFELLLVNLAVNARDAMPSGGTLSVQLTEASPEELTTLAPLVPPTGRPTRYARCEVRDSGSGIAADVLPHIFEPFFTTKGQGKGTGLGLSICYGIAQQSGGHIRARSRPGHGTSFIVCLPLTDAPERTEPATDAPVSMRGDETILLVEDEPAIRSLFSTVLRRNGYTVLDASSAEDAVAVAEAHGRAVDLLVSDVALPRASGAWLAQELISRALAARTLFVSGHAEALLQGGDGALPGKGAFVHKPLTGDALVAKVRELLDQPPSAP
ncbi:MAG: PAS domain S-box protein [Gemmatimonadaceae bacterium]|nr:PAS domain S-box protein [Gemmatimonadaceae bacterium]